MLISNVQSECSKCPLPAAVQAVSHLHHSLIASITSWSRWSHSSSTRWRNSSTSINPVVVVHTLVGSPGPHTAQSMGFRIRSNCSAAMWLIVSGLRAVHGRPLHEHRSTLPVASILLSTVLTRLNVHFLFGNILSIFLAPQSFCCLNTFIVYLSSIEKAYFMQYLTKKQLCNK